MEKSGEIMADLFGDDMKTDEIENWQKQKKDRLKDCPDAG